MASATLLAALFAIPAIPAVVAQQTSEEETVVLSPFEVDAQRDRGYGVENSLGASRIALANSDIANSIITLNEQFIKDSGAVDATEFLTYVSGMQINGDRNPGQVQYSQRGYALGGINLRDGIPENLNAADIPLDEESAYARIEVIKGPAGTLYGSHSMGGVVNKVSKWPMSVQQTEVQLQVAGGHDEFVRGVIDTTGPMGDSSAYRAVVSSRRGNRFYDSSSAPSDMDNITLAASHSLNNNGGKIWGRFQSLHYELDREQGWQYLTGYLTPGGGPAPEVTNPIFAISKDANIVPDDDISIGTSRSYEIGYEQPLGAEGDWTLRLVARQFKGGGDKSPSYSQGRPTAVDANGAVIGDNRFISALDPRVADWRAALSLRDFRGYQEGTVFNADLSGEFEALGVSHNAILTARYGTSERERAFFFWNPANPNNTTAVSRSFSAVNPDFTGVNAESIKATTTKQFNRFQGHTEGDGWSVGLQDNISFMEDKFILVAGARYDDASSDSYQFDVAQSIAADEFIIDESSLRQNSGTDSTYKIGAVFKPVDGMSLFAQNATTFNFVNSIDPLTGSKFPNQEGDILEIGSKFYMLNNRLVATVAWFDMELTNVIISVPDPDPNAVGGTIPQALGVQATDGFEVDIAWTPTDQLNLAFAYSDITSEDAQGNNFRGVPTDATYSLFGKYTFSNTGTEGWFVGGGYKHNARAPGDGGNSFFVSDSDLVDLFLGYNAENWSIQLNTYNVLGEDQILSAVIDRLAVRAPDTSYRLTARYRF